jgi:hypothetical protein
MYSMLTNDRSGAKIMTMYFLRILEIKFMTSVKIN